MAQFGNINKKFVSSLSVISRSDVDTRELLDSLIDVTKEQLSFAEMMRLAKRYKVTHQPEYSHPVNQELYAVETITDPAQTVHTSGTDITIRVSNANGTSFPRVKEVVLIPGANRRTAYVTAKTADASGDLIRLKSVSGSNMELANGQKISVLSAATGSGGKAMTARKYGVTYRRNVVQSFPESSPAITDIQNASYITFKIDGKPSYILLAQHHSYLLFQKNISNQMLFGEGTDNNFSATSPTHTDPDGNPVNFTKSLNQYVAEEGLNFANITFDLNFMKQFKRSMDKRRAGRDYMVCGGSELSIVFDDFFQALNTAILGNARYNITGRDVDLGITTATLYGRTFHKVEMSAFNEPYIVNFTGGAGYDKFLFFVPMDKALTFHGGKSYDRIQIRYMEQPKESSANVTSDGIYRETVLGGLGPVATSEEAIRQYHYRTIQGLEIYSGDQFARAWVTGTAS